MDQQSVPSSPMQQSGGAGLDISELIKNISTPLDPKLIQAATTPISGSHTPQVPTSLQTPVAQHQERPMNREPVVGAGNAKARGIENAFTGATNALGAVVTAEAQQKQNHIKDAATKVIMAQQAIDEAQQAHDTALASGNAEAASKAQELIQKNMQVRDGVFADPKIRKALVKGFDISYTDPESNKTEEHTAVQAAMKQAKTLQEKKQIMQAEQKKQQEAQAAHGQAAGAAFAKGTPQSLAPNQIAQAQLAVAQAQKKDLVDICKTLAPALVRADAAQRTEAVRSMTELTKQQNEMQQRVFERNQNFTQRLQLLGQQEAFQMRKLFTENSLILGREQERLKLMSTDPASVMKQADESDRTWNSAIAQQQTQYDTAAQNLAALRSSKGVTPQMISEAQASLEARQHMLDNAKDQASYYHKFYDAKRTMLGFGSSDNPPASKGVSDGNSSSKSTADPANSLTNWASGTDGWENFDNIQ